MNGKTRLFNRHFTLLWLGQSVSQLGNGAGFIGLMWWVQTTTGSALALGTLAMVQTLVGIAAGPFAGALTDRLDRKALIVGTDLIRGLNYVALAWLVWKGQLTMPLLYGIAALNALCGQFFGPAISASIPLLVPDDQLERANSLNQVTGTLVNIFGYALGGIMVALMGVPALLLVNGFSFILSAASESFIHIPRVVREKAALSAGLLLRDIRDGFLYVRNNRVLMRILQVAMILNFFTAPFFILLPKFVDEYLGGGSQIYGYLLSAQMAGALVAILVLSMTSLIRHNPSLVRWALVIQAVLYLSLPFLPPALWYIHVGIFAVAGLFSAIVNISFSTLMQRATPQQYMGKVFSLVGTMCQALQPAAQGITGLIADTVKVPVIYTFSSFFFLLGGLQFATIPGIMGFISGQKQADVQEEEITGNKVSAVA